MPTPSLPTSLPHPRAARRAAGLSIRQLARAAETVASCVCRYEKLGVYPVRLNARRRYLAALGLTDPQLHHGLPKAGEVVGGTVPASTDTNPGAPRAVRA